MFPMADNQHSTDRREDSFLSSRGIDQSTVVMVGAILVVAFLLLSLLGRSTPDNDELNATSRDSVDATSVDTATEPAADIAGSAPAAFDVR